MFQFPHSASINKQFFRGFECFALDAMHCKSILFHALHIWLCITTLQHYAFWSRTCYRTLAYVVRSGALRCVAVSAMSYVMRFITEYCSDTAIDCDSRYMHVTRAAIRIR